MKQVVTHAEVAKHLTGRTLEAGKFSFTISAEDNAPMKDANGAAITTGLTVTNGTDGAAVQFPEFYYTEADAGHTYIYKIVENSFSIPGYSRDTENGPEEIYAKVEVGSDKGDGTLNDSTVTYYSDKACTQTLTTSQFVNKYEAKGTAKVEVGKTLENKTLKDDDFSFTISSVDESPLKKEDGTAFGETELTVTNKSGKVTFPTLNYTLADAGETYVYKIVENDIDADKNPGVSKVGPEAIYAKVEVGSDKGDGTLNDAVVTYYSDEACETPLENASFTNKYDATGSVIFEGTKQVIDKDDTQEDRTFTFNVTYKNDGTEVNTGSVSLKDGETKDINFAAINYDLDTLKTLVDEEKATQNELTKTWTIVYIVREAVCSDTDMKANSQFVEVTVTVKDDGNGRLNTTVSPGKSSVAFVNTEQTDDQITIGGKKQMEGRQLSSRDKFSFTISALTDGAPLPKDTTVQNNGESFTFGPIKYNNTHVGKTYEYQVVEEDTNRPNVTKDSTPKTFKVTVGTDENGDVKAVTEPEDLTSLLTFKNKYTATGDAQTEVAKHLTGRTLDNGEFTFTISAVDGAPMNGEDGKAITTGLTVTNGADGAAVQFPKFYYTEKDAGKTYKYKIVENDFNISSVSRDLENGPSEIYAKVTVGADNETGTLADSTVEYFTDEACTDPLAKSQFTNKYEASGHTHAEVAKHLTGKTLEAGKFSFTISAEDNAPMKDANGAAITTGLTVTNGAEGAAVQFPEFYYTEADAGHTYIYKIVENSFSIPGYSRDTENGPEEIYAKVEVGSDKGDGTLNDSTVTYYSDKACTKELAKSQFTNKYEASGHTHAEVAKHLTGRTLEAGKFSFTISAEDNAPMKDANGAAITTGLTVTNGTDGAAVQFPEFYYTEADAGHTYIYKIVENSFSIPGYSRDTENGPEEIYAKVEVGSDKGDGTLNDSTVTYYSDKACTQTLTTSQFVNKYEAKGTAKVEVGKTLENKTLKDDDFSFTISSVDESPLKKEDGTAFGETELTVTNKSGKVTFPTLNYTLADAGETYVYKIVENDIDADKNPGVSKVGPEAIYAKVEVGSDKGDGTLNDAVVTYYSDEACETPLENASFTNKYDAVGKIGLSGTKKFDHGIFTDDEPFTFSVYKKSDFDAASSKLLGLKEVDRNELASDNDLKAKKVASASTEGKTADESGKVSFSFTPNIEFTLSTLDPKDKKADGSYEYHYVVVEDIPESAVKKTVGEETFYYDSDKDIKYDATVYDVTITVRDNGDGTLDVKASKDITEFGFENKKLYTKLELTKSIDSLVAKDTEGELTNVTCVFRITYTNPLTGKPVNRTASVKFDPSTVTAQKAVLEKIPIDAKDTIQVEEVYGADYTTGKKTKGVVEGSVDPETGIKIFTVEFDNTRSGNTTGGGVINKVSADKGEDGNVSGFSIKNKDGMNIKPPEKKPQEE